MLYATFKTQVITGGNSASFFDVQAAIFFQNLIDIYTAGWYYIQATQVLNENARKPLSIGYLAFSLCSDILAVLSVF